MLTVYFDESGTDAASDIVVMAGWIATDIQWLKFTPQWTNILKAARLDPPIFHATDYEAMRTLPPAKKIQLRQRLITTIEKRVRSYAAVAVMKRPYEAAAAEGLHPDVSIEAYAVLEVVKKVRDWVAQHAASHEVAYFFENRAEKRGEVETMMAHIESTPRLREQFRYAQWGWVPKSHPPAQAADMLAYEIWKECVNNAASPRRYPMRKSLQALTHIVPNFSFYREGTS